MKRFFIISFSCLFFLNVTCDLPDGFVYVDEISPNMIVELRYFTNENFVASKIDGYKRNRAILTKEAALALNESARIFESNGYNIVIYDAYRPQKAVNHFLKWSQDPSADQSMKLFYYPYLEHGKVFEEGYVSEKSGHSRGSTVDMTIINRSNSLTAINETERTLNDGRKIQYLDDNTIDMGSSFDLFDVASHSNSKLIDLRAQIKRDYLITVMDSAGFTNYPNEWWHFTLRDEPYPDTYFNFDIE